jgi:hypothetical protein
VCGRALARKTGKTFYDSDHEIEARTGVRVATIFDIEGELRFRDRESSSLPIWPEWTILFWPPVVVQYCDRKTARNCPAMAW